MKDVELEQRIEFLEERRQAVELELKELKKTAPAAARLRAVKHGSRFQYFLRKDESDINGVYIRMQDEKMAVMLAQIEYDEILLKLLQNTLTVLDKHGAMMTRDPFEEALAKMPEGKRRLVTIHHMTDEEYLNNWKKKEFEGLPFRGDYPEYYTRQGLRVRSKSEMIIADMLDEFSIPFLYEKPLRLKNGVVHPDFTLLNIKQRREIYWEHFGMVDDLDYRNNAFHKIRNYESTSLYQHDSVIWTFETEKFPLNTKEIRKMIMVLKKSLGYSLMS